jgi:hypothetical protein
MKSTLALCALLAAGFALPAYAQEADAIDPAKSAAFASYLTASAAEHQARLQLAHLGYASISPLNRDTQGRWIGTAIKDGKQVTVGVDLHKVQRETATN